MEDRVNHPAHYDLPGLGVESIEVIKAVLGPEGFRKFCRGCALKYLIRADKKGGAEDLQKARVYITWEIETDGEKEQSKDVVNEPTIGPCSHETVVTESHVQSLFRKEVKQWKRIPY